MGLKNIAFLFLFIIVISDGLEYEKIIRNCTTEIFGVDAEPPPRKKDLGTYSYKDKCFLRCIFIEEKLMTEGGNIDLKLIAKEMNVDTFECDDIPTDGCEAAFHLLKCFHEVYEDPYDNSTETKEQEA